jgi:Tol biopolymer transport system component
MRPVTTIRSALRALALLAVLAQGAWAAPAPDTLLLTCEGCGAGAGDERLATIAVRTGALRPFRCPVGRCGRADDAVWSPTGAQIAVVRLGDAGRLSIWAFPAAGGRGRPLTHPTASTTDSRPVWSPNARFLAFERDTDRSSSAVKSTLMVIDLDAGKTTRVAGSRAANVGRASFSPDSGRLVFLRTPRLPAGGAPTGSLWIVGRDGRGLRRLTRGDDLDHAHWRRDGRIGALDTKGRSVLIDPRTGAETRGPAIGPVDYPTWSPNGRRLAFYRELGSDVEGPFVFDVASGRVRRLSRSGSACLLPAAWSPDGSRLAFCTSAGDPNDPNDAGTTGIWVERADGGGMRKLWSQYGAEIYSLAWRPSY